MTESTSAVEQAVQARIAAARIKVQAAKQRRDELSAARRRGLAARHANKLRRQAEKRQADDQDDGGGERQPVTRPRAHETPAANPSGRTTEKENPMTKRTLVHGQDNTLADEIRDHGYAIFQTRVERIPRLRKGLLCQEPDGCTKPATLATLAVDAVTEDDDGLGLHLVKDPDGNPQCIVTCDEHRCDASHDLYYRLTERLRPDGIRAYDAPGQYLHWT